MRKYSRQRLAPILASLAALPPFAIDAYLPALPRIGEYFSADIQLIEASISIFLLGLALGQIVGAPMSDRYGRKPMAMSGLAIFGVSSLLILVCGSVDQFLIFRFLQALGGGVAVVNVGAIVSDFFDAQDAARTFNSIGAITVLAPLVAPVIGAALIEFFDWHSVFVFLLLYCAGLAWFMSRKLPETVAQNARRDGSLIGQAFRGFVQVFSRTEAMGYALCMGFTMGCMFVFLTDSAFVYMDQFGVSPRVFTVLFGANIASIWACNRLNRQLLKTIEAARIIPVACGVQLAAATLFWIHVTTMEPSLYVVGPLLMVSVGVLGLAVGNSIACFLAHFPKIRGTASGVSGSFQFALGGVLGTVIGIVHDGTLATTGAGMCLSALVANVALSFARTAPVIREQSPAPS